jgi:hypothetical protein
LKKKFPGRIRSGAAATLFSVFVFACSTARNDKGASTQTYTPPSRDLHDTIARMDSLMFAAFNEHNIDKLKTFFSEDLEFYHDKGGVDNYLQTMENFKILFANNRNTGLRRDIVKESLEVYPVKDYGAVETCLHRFCHVENGKDDCGTFKNMMIWQRKNGQWKVTRVVSYGH